MIINDQNITRMKKVCDHFVDDVSKEIYADRVICGLTKDDFYWQKLRMYTDIARKLTEFSVRARGKGIVLFGGGEWIRNIFLLGSRFFSYKCIIDNNEDMASLKVERILDHLISQRNTDECMRNIPIYNAEDYIKENIEDFYVITSQAYCDELMEQLLRLGVERDHILDFGITYTYMWGNQYFDTLPIADDEVFIDAGCYDGNTTIEFLKCCKGKYSKIYAFEPDKECFNKCKENLSGIKNLELMNYGLWDKNEVLRFTATADTASKITEDGETLIETKALDTLFGDERVTFIKMDIEGAEYNALKGAEKIIRKWKPKLAICVYHKLEDIYTIPELILEYNPNYKLYLRHYCYNACETILYAI